MRGITFTLLIKTHLQKKFVIVSQILAARTKSAFTTINLEGIHSYTCKQSRLDGKKFTSHRTSIRLQEISMNAKWRKVKYPWLTKNMLLQQILPAPQVFGYLQKIQPSHKPKGITQFKQKNQVMPLRLNYSISGLTIQPLLGDNVTFG